MRRRKAYVCAVHQRKVRLLLDDSSLVFESGLTFPLFLPLISVVNVFTRLLKNGQCAEIKKNRENPISG
jgi:hypothetical protein